MLKDLAVSGSDNGGLFCNTMESGSSLIASLTNSSGVTINVTATSGDAGGYVGKMERQGTLTISGKAVNTVDSKSGNAGGLVGDYTNTTGVALDLSKYVFSDIILIGGSSSNTGVVFGLLTNKGSYTISNASVTSNLTAGTNYSGVIGKYEAQDNGDIPARKASLRIDGSATLTYCIYFRNWWKEVITCSLRKKLNIKQQKNIVRMPRLIGRLIRISGRLS